MAEQMAATIAAKWRLPWAITFSQIPMAAKRKWNIPLPMLKTVMETYVSLLTNRRYLTTPLPASLPRPFLNMGFSNEPCELSLANTVLRIGLGE